MNPSNLFLRAFSWGCQLKVCERLIRPNAIIHFCILAPSFAIVKRELLTTVDPGPAEDDAKFVRIQTLNSDGTKTKLIFDKEELSQLKQGIKFIICRKIYVLNFRTGISY